MQVTVNKSSDCQNSGMQSQFCSQKGILENIVKRRFILAPAYEIYGNTTGLFDFGPTGSALKSEIETVWKNIFVKEDDLLEVHCTNLTPCAPLVASGHVDRFEDFILYDTVTKNYYRADKILEELLHKIKPMTESVQEDIRKLSGFKVAEFDELIKKYKLKSPDGNDFSNAMPFNLMFKTNLGPLSVDSNNTAYLRPETAQGILCNFKRLLECNRGQLPFGVAQIGTAFRNEISPRNGLLRVREFVLAEIEYFYDPEASELLSPIQKEYIESAPAIKLLSADRQKTSDQSVSSSVSEALKSGIIKNSLIAYYMAKTQTFLLKIGIINECIRWRQHMSTEMAHYANDCWDAEILTSSGWIEAVGIANRGDFDLKQHSSHTNRDLTALRVLKKPREQEVLKCIPVKREIAKQYKALTPVIIETLLDTKTINELKTLYDKNERLSLTLPNQDVVELNKDMLSFTTEVVRLTDELFFPKIVEPSFGLGRIMHCLLEHTLKKREDDRYYFDFPILVAPYKCILMALINKEELVSITSKLKMRLAKAGIFSKVDNSNASIGRRYSRADEIGIPYTITVDFETLEDNSVTLRHTSLLKQIRIPISEVVDFVKRIFSEVEQWPGKYEFI
uniref:glycine--tRNA ligase n=1 Tax=Dermatophagoides pteronyssinus TaxID=6956 RepID=A0A6P6XKW7_DERPT|nr:glycine--tRNA ligase-like [Dermatophagoides pteronyssinus]